jgi:hypothetical protein
VCVAGVAGVLWNGWLHGLPPRLSCRLYTASRLILCFGLLLQLPSPFLTCTLQCIGIAAFGAAVKRGRAKGIGQSKYLAHGAVHGTACANLVAQPHAGWEYGGPLCSGQGAGTPLGSVWECPFLLPLPPAGERAPQEQLHTSEEGHCWLLTGEAPACFCGQLVPVARNQDHILMCCGA